MAGLGRKVFNSGDILLASEVQGFLQDQSVMVFDDDDARTAAIATPTEGMVTFRKDDNALEVFAGSTFVAVGGGSESGLVHINSTSFSAVASQSINDVFSSDYDNYKIIVNIETFTGTAGLLLMRLRVSGTDNSNNEYTRSKFVYVANNTIAAGDGSGGTSSFLIGQPATNTRSIIELSTPFLTQKTNHNGQYNQSTAGFIVSGQTTVTTSYTGFTLLLSAATNITGSVSVYGYAKA